MLIELLELIYKGKIYIFPKISPALSIHYYRRAASVLPSRCVKEHQYTLLYNVSSRTLVLVYITL